ncbi:MAG: M23 family metallopeptidase [Anaeromyxobacter sp.]
MRLRAALAAAALVFTACPAPPRSPVRAPPIELAPVAPRAQGGAPAAPASHEEPAIAGVMHPVRRGETLYRIAKAYGIDLADLMETNGITDPRQVAVGTELFVPGATALVEVPPSPGTEPAPAVATAPPREPARAHPAPAAAADPPPEKVTARPPPMDETDAGKRRLAWPLKGVLYGRFGVRGGARHDGIDIAAPEGTPVKAAEDGEVIYVGEQTGYGVVVILRHSGGLVTVYAHNSAVLVKEGARVGRGAPIAKVGQTGRTTGPHLHFEVREGTRPKNPLLYLSHGD